MFTANQKCSSDFHWWTFGTRSSWPLSIVFQNKNFFFPFRNAYNCCVMFHQDETSGATSRMTFCNQRFALQLNSSGTSFPWFPWTWFCPFVIAHLFTLAVCSTTVLWQIIICALVKCSRNSCKAQTKKHSNSNHGVSDWFICCSQKFWVMSFTVDHLVSWQKIKFKWRVNISVIVISVMKELIIQTSCNLLL